MNEATFPSNQSIRADAVNDERRLAYVAFTRAKERLIVHYRRPQDQNAERGIRKPSRFLYEAGILTSDSPLPREAMALNESDAD